MTKKVVRTLRDQGWKAIRIWEHDLRADPDEVLRRVVSARKRPSNSPSPLKSK